MRCRDLWTHWRVSAVCVTGFLAFVAGRLTSVAIAGELYDFHHENVLGTSLEIQVLASDAAAAGRAERRVLATIDRLDAVFSTWNRDSEFSQWQAGGAELRPISPDLAEVLEEAERWQQATGGAFHAGARLFSEIWSAAERRNALPAVDDLARGVQALQTAPWVLAPPAVAGGPHRAGRPSDYPLSLNAIAKGYIVDEACRVLLASPPGSPGQVEAGLVKIGGDLRVLGPWHRPVVIRDPARPAGSGVGLQVAIENAGLATSGNAWRGFTVNGTRYSHVIDPRSGWPVEQVVSATVVAPSAQQADALATAFSVLGVAESLALARRVPNVECLLIDREGRRSTSPGWDLRAWSTGTEFQLAQRGGGANPGSVKPTDTERQEPAPDWNGGFELEVKLEIANVDGGRRYRRPYVAVWIEDAQGYPVRTLALWVQKTGKGPRWIPDLKRWHKTDEIRQFDDERDLVATLSEPTRKPGEYSLAWDGTDHRGELVAAGDYVISIESAREHGTYQLIREKVKLGGEPVQAKLKGNNEIKAASVDYHRRAAKPVAK